MLLCRYSEALHTYKDEQNKYLPHNNPVHVKPLIQSHIVPLHTALSSIHVSVFVTHTSPTRVPTT